MVDIYAPFLRCFYDRGYGMKRINHRHYICVTFIALMVLWSVFVCYNSYIRLWETMKDLGLSFVYALFFTEEWCPKPTLNEPSSVDVISLFPQEWAAFLENVDLFWEKFFSLENFIDYLIWLIPVINTLVQLMLIGSMFYLVFVLSKLMFKPTVNNDHGEETKYLKRFLKFEYKVIRPVYSYVLGVIGFFFSHKAYFVPAVIMFVVGTNLVSILFAILAFYFYFVASLDISVAFYQIYKLSVDILVMLASLPLPVWILVFAIVFDKATKHFAYQRLSRQEEANKTVVSSLGLVVFVTGAMRSGKTKLITSMQISQAAFIRELTLDIMLDVHSRFPNFPYPVFIQKLNSLIDQHKIYSLASVERYITFIEKKFVEEDDSRYVFGYDVEHYSLFYDNGLTVSTLFESLETFAKAYLVYQQKTLFIGSYSVRDSDELSSLGNMPAWDTDPFKRPSFSGEGVFSHILDQDELRPGKKFCPEEKKYGAVEFGIIGNPEIDKERANTLELQETKKNEDECNQKNDLFNQHLKMMGHAAMVDFKCMLKMFTDSQRVTSWGADGRELSDMLLISDKSEERLALRFFGIRALIGDKISSFVKTQTFQNWYFRGDRTLLKYLIDNTLGRYLNYCERIKNTFGYTVVTLDRQLGTEEGEKILHKWYSANKKENAARYATDSYAQYFRKFNNIAGIGLGDIECYDTLHPSLEELYKKQNSHFIKSFMENQDSNADVKKKKRKE